MKIIFSENAERELDDAEQELRKLFVKHIEKLQFMPPRRHLRFGLPFNVEDVTKQARMVYQVKKEVFYVIHCFKSHKEYEKWFKSVK